MFIARKTQTLSGGLVLGLPGRFYLGAPLQTNAHSPGQQVQRTNPASDSLETTPHPYCSI